MTHLLNSSQVLIHSFIIGEIACGNFSNRDKILPMLKKLPTLFATTDSEVLYFIEQNKLMGLGISYIDVHLLAATILEPEALLWTRDKRLKAVADDLNLAYQIKKC